MHDRHSAPSTARSFLCKSCDGPIPFASATIGMPIACAGCSRAYTWQDGVLILGESADPDDYPEELHALLAEVEPQHFWFGERNRLILSTMREVLGQLAGRAVLDIGCGTGFVTAALERAGMDTWGLDMNLAGLRHARVRVRGPLLCEDAARVPFTGQFDVSMLCDVIEHTPDDGVVLREAVHALKPGGAVVVTVPAHPFLWSTLDDASGHKRRYTRATLASAMAEAGLRVRVVRYFNTVLFPVQVLQRLLMRGRPAQTPEARLAIVRDALRVPPPLQNGILRLAMSADLALSRLPKTAGTSLIAIGERA